MIIKAMIVIFQAIGMILKSILNKLSVVIKLSTVLALLKFKMAKLSVSYVQIIIFTKVLYIFTIQLMPHIVLLRSKWGAIKTSMRTIESQTILAFQREGTWDGKNA